MVQELTINHLFMRLHLRLKHPYHALLVVVVGVGLLVSKIVVADVFIESLAVSELFGHIYMNEVRSRCIQQALRLTNQEQS